MQRKVVLDAKTLAESKQYRHSPQQIRAAESADESALLFLFGHGHRDNHGIVLGEGDREILKIGEFKSATKAFNTSVTSITTSYYSGGWTCIPQLNLRKIDGDRT